jgi:hypothetical protein
MTKKVKALFIACVLGVCMAAATDQLARSSPPVDGIPVQLQKVIEQLQPIESKSSAWEREARWATILTLLVGLLGIVTGGIQAFDKKYLKVVTLIFGMTISGITLVNSTLFHPPRTLKVYALQLRHAAERIRRQVSSYDTTMAAADVDRLARGVQSQLIGAINLKANLEQKLEGEITPENLQASISFLPWTVVHASSEQPQPTWVSTLPRDTVYMYFVGTGESDSLQGAEDAARVNAYDQGARQVAPQLGESDLEGVRIYVANSSEEAATYFRYERATHKYRYYKLLRMSKAFLDTDVARALMRKKVLLKLERVFCLQDGSAGATDWYFDVKYSGKTIIQLSRRSYDDRRPESKSGIKPLAVDHAEATIELPEGGRAAIELFGYRSFGNKLSATGKGFVTVNGVDSPIEVEGQSERAGHFKFDFTAAKVGP